MKEAPTGNDSRIRKVLFNEVALFAGLIGVLFGVFNMLQSPKTDIEIGKQLDNLRDNHIHTIEVQLDEQAATVNAIQLQIVELKTILNERLPSKK